MRPIAICRDLVSLKATTSTSKPITISISTIGMLRYSR